MSLPVSQVLIDKIEQLALEADGFGFYLIDEQGTILDKGGELNSLELPDWRIGENILDKALFLHGYLPLEKEYGSIVCYQLSDSCVIDIHLLMEETGTLILFIDRSKETEEEARTRQQRNEERLRKRYSNPRT